MEPFQSDQVKLFYGKAMLILKSGKDTGPFSFTPLRGSLSLKKTAIPLMNLSICKMQQVVCTWYLLKKDKTSIGKGS